jgi:hypothetical protein
MIAAQVLPDIPSLPAKPKDPLGRFVVWVALVQSPGFVYEGKPYKVDDAFIQDQIDTYKSLTRADYTAPLLAEHEKDGMRKGDWLALDRVVIDERPTLIGAVAMAIPDAKDKIRRGEIKYFSPSFGKIEDDRGRVFRFAFREGSMTSAPHQKHMTPGETHILGKEQSEMDKDKSTEQEVSTSDAPSLEERMGKLEKQMAEFMAMMEAAMVEDDDEGKEEEGPQMGESAESAEVVSLREQVEALEDERDRAVWDQGDRKVLTVTPELDALLYAAWRKDKEGVSAMLSEASKAPAKEKQPAKQPEPTPVSPWVRMSEAAPVPSSDDIKPATDADLSAKSLEMAEGDQVKALKIYKELKAQRLH